MKQLSLLLLNFTFILGFTYAQESECSVSMISLIGTYTGDCKKGKAEGMGKAIGTDVYEGAFKNGYPDGEGLYTWRSGKYYRGMFKKGEMTGMGELHIPTYSGQDSVVAGFWNNGNYIRRFEVPYKFHYGYPRGWRIKVLRKTSTTGTIDFITLNSSVLEVVVAEGEYKSTTFRNNGNLNFFTIYGIRYPFKARFMMDNGINFEATFFETADYNIRN